MFGEIWSNKIYSITLKVGPFPGKLKMLGRKPHINEDNNWKKVQFARKDEDWILDDKKADKVIWLVQI